MYAMQYAVNLPTDYDMGVIRDRVSRTGHLMNGFAGLEFKEFVIRERAQGALRNEYSPFYVWRDVDGMRSFCWGEPGYSAIVRDFGRQPIQDWTVQRMVRGSRAYEDAASLTIRTVALPDGVAPSACLEEVTGPFLAGVDDATVARVAAVDVTSWTVVLAELSAARLDQGPDDRATYEVLHVALGS